MTWSDFPCKEWPGARLGPPPNHYGNLKVKNKRWLVHRYEWTQKRGPIPKGKHVLHHCDNPPCYEIEHLFLGTHKENMLDRDTKGRGGGGKFESAKTHCPQGHPYNATNTSWYRNQRKCRTCHRNREAERRKRKKAT